MGVLSSRFPCPSDGAYTTPIDEVRSRFKGQIQVHTESALVRNEQFPPPPPVVSRRRVGDVGYRSDEGPLREVWTWQPRGRWRTSLRITPFGLLGGVSTLRARYAIYMRECYKYNCFVYVLLTIILSMISCSCPLN